MVAGQGQKNKSSFHVMSRSSDQCDEILIAQKAHKMACLEGHFEIAQRTQEKHVESCHKEEKHTHSSRISAFLPWLAHRVPVRLSDSTSIVNEQSSCACKVGNLSDGALLRTASLTSWILC